MKRIIITTVCLATSLIVFSQTSAVGKQIDIVQTQKLSTGVSMMGQEMEIPSTGIIYANIVVNKADSKNTTITSTVKRMTGSVSMMGQDQNFDTDDKASGSNPMAAEVLKKLNKPEELTIVNGRVAGQEEDFNSLITPGISSVANILFLPREALIKKEGDKWTVEEIGKKNAANKCITIYTISKTTSSEIEITANSSIAIDGTMQMMGNDVKQKINGSLISVCSYNKETGILLGAAQSINMSGTIEIMGSNAPVTSKGTITIAVK